MTFARRAFALLLVACGGGSGSSGSTSSSGEPPAEDGGGPPVSGPRLPSLDPPFGSNGEVSFDFGAIDARAYDVVLTADGKIVVAGSLGDASDTQPTRVFVARLTGEGALDPTFGGGQGFVVMDDDPYTPRLVLESGRPLHVASSKLRRLANDGTIEAELDEQVRALTELDGGMIIAATSDTLVRLTPDLQRDTTFGDGGAKPAGTSGVFDVFRVGGGFVIASSGDPTLVKYDASGVIDTTFGDGGKVMVDEGDLHRATLLGSRIVVFGSREPGSGMFVRPHAIAFAPNGQVDTAYGTGGALTTTNAGSFGDSFVVPDGRLFVIEHMPFATNIVRFSDAGAFVSSTGVASTNPLSTSPAWTGTAFAVEANGTGKVVVVGNVYDPPNGGAVRKRRVWVARFTN